MQSKYMHFNQWWISQYIFLQSEQYAYGTKQHESMNCFWAGSFKQTVQKQQMIKINQISQNHIWKKEDIQDIVSDH